MRRVKEPSILTGMDAPRSAAGLMTGLTSDGPKDAIEVRSAASSDNAILASLGAQTFSDTYAESNDPEDMTRYISGFFSPARISCELADPKAHFFLAYAADSSGPIGYAKLRWRPAMPLPSDRLSIELQGFTWFGTEFVPA